MAVVRDPSDWEESRRSHSAEPYLPFKSERGSTRRVGVGSFSCPECDVPVTLGGPVSLYGRMRCPFCRGIHPVRSYVRLDYPDTSLNSVELRARLPLP